MIGKRPQYLLQKDRSGRLAKMVSIFVISIAGVLTFFFPLLVFAYTIQPIESGIAGDFIVTPAKSEIMIDLGESTSHAITVINRTGESRTFSISVEDISGTHDSENPVALFGEQSGPYSVKQYVTPELETFSLDSNEKITFSVTIDVPETAEPGGLYGAVLVSSQTYDGLSGSSGARVVSRIVSILLLDISGEAHREGALKQIKIVGAEKTFYTSAPEQFEIEFENTGNVHLKPEGSVRIKNMFGREVAKINVPSFFALPDATRFQEIIWSDPGFRFGRYTATAEIARGYEDKVDVVSVAFWVLPVKETLALIVIGILIFIFRGKIKR